MSKQRSRQIYNHISTRYYIYLQNKSQQIVEQCTRKVPLSFIVTTKLTYAHSFFLSIGGLSPGSCAITST